MNLHTSDMLETLFSLENKVGIVTGASKGIGEEIANVLADAGAKVFDLSRSENTKLRNPNIHWIETDITDTEALSKSIRGIGELYGIDFLINNAGITKRIKAEEVDQDWWQKIHSVNVDALFFASQAAQPYLTQSKYTGRIINISSMASYMGFREVVPYNSTKASVCGITRGLAVEWADKNILVNSVSPGWFQSEMNKQVVDDARHQKIMSKIALARYGNIKEIGYMTLFLISEASTYITGQDISVDGGARAYGY